MTHQLPYYWYKILGIELPQVFGRILEFLFRFVYPLLDLRDFVIASGFVDQIIRPVGESIDPQDASFLCHFNAFGHSTLNTLSIHTFPHRAESGLESLQFASSKHRDFVSAFPLLHIHDGAPNVQNCRLKSVEYPSIRLRCTGY